MDLEKFLEFSDKKLKKGIYIEYNDIGFYEFDFDIFKKNKYLGQFGIGTFQKYIKLQYLVLKEENTGTGSQIIDLLKKYCIETNRNKIIITHVAKFLPDSELTFEDRMKIFTHIGEKFNMEVKRIEKNIEYIIK